MLRSLAMVGTALLPLLALPGCAETRLPDLTVPINDHTRFGTDLGAEHPVFGVTVTDPFRRMSG